MRAMTTGKAVSALTMKPRNTPSSANGRALTHNTAVSPSQRPIRQIDASEGGPHRVDQDHDGKDHEHAGRHLGHHVGPRRDGGHPQLARPPRRPLGGQPGSSRGQPRHQCPERAHRHHQVWRQGTVPSTNAAGALVAEEKHVEGDGKTHRYQEELPAAQQPAHLEAAERQQRGDHALLGHGVALGESHEGVLEPGPGDFEVAESNALPHQRPHRGVGVEGAERDPLSRGSRRP